MSLVRPSTAQSVDGTVRRHFSRNSTGQVAGYCSLRSERCERVKVLNITQLMPRSMCSQSDTTQLVKEEIDARHQRTQQRPDMGEGVEEADKACVGGEAVRVRNNPSVPATKKKTASGKNGMSRPPRMQDTHGILLSALRNAKLFHRLVRMHAQGHLQLGGSERRGKNGMSSTNGTLT